MSGVRRRAPAWRRFAADRGGAAAVEMAMVMPIFVTLLFGVFELGWATYCGSDVRHAIERAVRLYLTNASTTDQQFKSAVASNLTAASMNSISLSITKPVVSGAQMVKVSWTYHYPINIPFVSTLNMNFDSQLLAPVRPS